MSRLPHEGEFSLRSSDAMRTLGPSTLGFPVVKSPTHLRSGPSVGGEHFRTSFVSSTVMASNGRALGLAPWIADSPWMGIHRMGIGWIQVGSQGMCRGVFF